MAILKCTSNYPADPKDSNISTIPYLRKKYKCEIGLSDHTLGIGVAVGSIALGSTIIEKHFITSRTLKGVDSEFSADEKEFENLINEAKLASRSVGKIFIGPTQNENASLRFRRSIYACKKIKKGERFSEKNISH